MAKEKEQEGAVANSSDALSVPKARVLAEVFAPNGKIRVELLPPEVAGGSAEGGSVNLQPLEERVVALENHLITAQKVIDCLGGDLLRVTPSVEVNGRWFVTRTFPFSVKLPEGIDAYALGKVSDWRKGPNFDMLGDGKSVPLCTPVVLVAKENKEYVLSPAPYSSPIDTGLVGFIHPVSVDTLDFDKYVYLVLWTKSKNFAPITKNYESKYLPPYRAFIKVPKDSFGKPTEASTTES